ncbi:hypothetical protein PISL3812_00436 [Talaromyces islandicus]|uniref:Uncharacterized protein n=1 Tax=Talaromyces islandicus TaxID=28573 RepID=A0A0U1LJB8_TALIS|nr:hypothetical protein PISL3812_00436 [Talaromyces islandicus]
MKAALIISVICAVAAAAPTPDGGIDILSNSNLEVDGILNHDNIIQTRSDNPIVDILDNGKVKVTDTVEDINIGKGLVSGLKKETRDDKLPIIAGVLKHGGGIGADNVKGINIARDNSVVDVLQDGAAIVHDNVEDIDIL